MAINSGCCCHIQYGAACRATRTHTVTQFCKSVRLRVFDAVSFWFSYWWTELKGGHKLSAWATLNNAENATEGLTESSSQGGLQFGHDPFGSRTNERNQWESGCWRRGDKLWARDAFARWLMLPNSYAEKTRRSSLAVLRNTFCVTVENVHKYVEDERSVLIRFSKDCVTLESLQRSLSYIGDKSLLAPWQCEKQQPASIWEHFVRYAKQ